MSNYHWSSILWITILINILVEKDGLGDPKIEIRFVRYVQENQNKADSGSPYEFDLRWSSLSNDLDVWWVHPMIWISHDWDHPAILISYDQVYSMISYDQIHPMIWISNDQHHPMISIIQQSWSSYDLESPMIEFIIRSWFDQNHMITIILQSWIFINRDHHMAEINYGWVLEIVSLNVKTLKKVKQKYLKSYHRIWRATILRWLFRNCLRWVESFDRSPLNHPCCTPPGRRNPSSGHSFWSHSYNSIPDFSRQTVYWNTST